MDDWRNDDIIHEETRRKYATWTVEPSHTSSNNNNNNNNNNIILLLLIIIWTFL